MGNKIVLITNRGVRPKRRGATLFKNKLSKSSHRLRCAEVNPGSKKNKYKLTLVDKGNEQNYLNHVVSSSNNKPWVFFVHGNNQTLDKNLEKCFKLRELYDVNVLAFSWPSVHHGKIRGALNYIPRQPSIGRYLTRQLKAKQKQYIKAKVNAELSAPDLSKSLAMAESAFIAANANSNFVCHSLGHYVLQNSHEHVVLGKSMSCFKNVLLHQGDADNEDHESWVYEINKGKSVVVTTNEKDKILELSNIFNHKSMKNARLGNVRKLSDENSVKYKDFTGAKNIGFSGHSIFLTPSSKNEEVHSFFKSIIGE